MPKHVIYCGHDENILIRSCGVLASVLKKQLLMITALCICRFEIEYRLYDICY